MCSGVGKSGSPAPNPMTFSPDALSALALASTASVADSVIAAMRSEIRATVPWWHAARPGSGPISRPQPRIGVCRRLACSAQWAAEEPTPCAPCSPCSCSVCSRPRRRDRWRAPAPGRVATAEGVHRGRRHHRHRCARRQAPRSAPSREHRQGDDGAHRDGAAGARRDGRRQPARRGATGEPDQHGCRRPVAARRRDGVADDGVGQRCRVRDRRDRRRREPGGVPGRDDGDRANGSAWSTARSPIRPASTTEDRSRVGRE